MELTLEKLGHIVNQEQQQDAADDARKGSGHSKSRSSTRQLAKQRARGYD